MSIVLLLFCCTMAFMKARVVEVFTSTGVGQVVSRRISSSVLSSSIAFFVLKNAAMISASAAEVTTFLKCSILRGSMNRVEVFVVLREHFYSVSNSSSGSPRSGSEILVRKGKRHPSKPTNALLMLCIQFLDRNKYISNPIC